MNAVQKFSCDRWALFFLLLAAVLLVANLGNGCLWQDEAETAVLGWNILHVGYPCAFDGVNRLNPSLPLQKGYAWTYHSWLPMYMAAASFYLFGKNTVAARLPFALMGIAAVWLGYLLARRLTGDRWIARFTTVTLVLSVPFLLHMRQCRYYAPAVFFSLWAALAYWRFFCCRRWAAMELSLALILLFHADHGVFLPVFGAFVVHFFLNPAAADRRTDGWIVCAVVLAATIPWMIYLKIGQHHRALSLKEISHHLQFYFRQINHFLVPILFWLLLTLFYRPHVEALFGSRKSILRQAWMLVAYLIAMGMVFLILIPEQRHFRYLIFLVPFFFLIQANLMAWIFRSRRWVALVLMPLLLFTDLFHSSGLSLLAAQIPAVGSRLKSSPGSVHSLPVKFLWELTHPYRGPMDGVIELLKKEARPGQTVKIPYEDHVLLFYTDLVVEPIRTPEDFARQTFPEWIILRRDWLASDFLGSSYYKQIQARYRKIVVNGPDIPWQNRPDPGYHRFLTDHQAPLVTVFRKK